MKVLKAVFALLFAATLFTACQEEVIRPDDSFEIEFPLMDDTGDHTPAAPKPGSGS